MSTNNSGTRAVLSVVVPAYNESEYLEQTVRDIRDGLLARDVRFELILVENGSRDDTLRVAGALGAVLPDVVVRSLSRADYGAALRDGMLAARGDVVACFDADYYDLAFLDAGLVELEHADLVVGSKRARGSIDTRSWHRRLVTTLFGFALHAGFGLALSDTHGVKVMRREFIADLVPRCAFDGDLFDTELVIRASRAGCGVVELPVVVAERRPPRTSVWARAPRALAGLVRLRLTLLREHA